ncbi:MAG TPA: homoserine dehydrogenase [Candidatus Koribacter sp.]
MASTFSRAPEPAVRPCKIALLGFGTVGSAVVRLLHVRNGELPFQLTHVYNRDVARKRVDWVDDEVRWTDDFEDLLKSDAEVIVELVGGVDGPYQWVKQALLAGKSVVTANKQLIAHRGSELLALAKERDLHLGFGACVAGGVPVIAALQDGLAGDRLKKVRGILNGTCNYILNKIEESGAAFADALKEAQHAGFAEADPTDDIEGYDARAKLVILARVGLNADVRVDEIACRSIAGVQQVDFEYAHQLGCTIRQISRAERHGDRLLACVEPALVPLTEPLARVAGSQNLLVSTGEFGGETVFAGFGAGGNPTAVAVVSDLLHIAHHKPRENDNAAPVRYDVSSDFQTPHYVRFVIQDKLGIIAAIANVLSKNGINIDSVLQKPGCSKSELPFVMTLETCGSVKVAKALEEIAKLDFHQSAPFCMPILR